MFKVGDKMWSLIYQKVMFVSEVRNQGCFLAGDETLLINYWHTNSEISKTAQTMFEELGYIQYDIKDTHYIEHEKNGDIIKVKDNKVVECLLYEPNIINKIKAIHQMCIELGWL